MAAGHKAAYAQCQPVARGTHGITKDPSKISQAARRSAAETMSISCRVLHRRYERRVLRRSVA